MIELAGFAALYRKNSTISLIPSRRVPVEMQPRRDAGSREKPSTVLSGRKSNRPTMFKHQVQRSSTNHTIRESRAPIRLRGRGLKQMSGWWRIDALRKTHEFFRIGAEKKLRNS